MSYNGQQFSKQRDLQIALSPAGFLLWLTLFILGATIGCSRPPLVSSNSDVSTDRATQGYPTAIATAPSLTLALPTDVASATGELTTEALSNTPSGWLLMSDPVGIRQIKVPDGKWEYVLRKSENWLKWGANFSENKELLAYWVRYSDRNEVWVTSLSRWQPERVLLVEEDIDLGAIWAVNDRYILSQLTVVDNSGPLEENKTVRTYIVDMNTGSLVNDPYWPGSCNVVAPSPSSGKLSLWCIQADPDTTPQYLVLESETAPWVTEHPPDIIIDNCISNAVCAWSADDRYIAYIVQSSIPEPLYYSPVSGFAPVHLEDEQSEHISFPLWSPDSQYLYYVGGCAALGISCPNVMSIKDQRVIWRAEDSSGQDLGLDAMWVTNVSWSPNSRYLAIPGYKSSRGGDLFVLFDVLNQENVGQVYAGTDILGDTVWLEYPVRQ